MKIIIDEFTDLDMSPYKKWRLRHPERDRIYKKRYYEKLKKDKERYSKVLKRQVAWKKQHMKICKKCRLRRYLYNKQKEEVNPEFTYQRKMQWRVRRLLNG